MDSIETLYARLTAGRRKTVRDLPDEERRAYVAQRVREHRRRQKEAVVKGSPEPTVPMIRDALAVAALAILASTRPGPTRSGESSPASSLAVPESPAR